MYTIKRIKEVIVEETTEEQVSLSEFVGFKFREKRLKKGLKVEDVAALSKDKISSSHISRVERGNPSLRLKDIELLCEILDIDVKTLFSEPILEKEQKAEETL